MRTRPPPSSTHIEGKRSRSTRSFPRSIARDAARLAPWMGKLLVALGDLTEARDLLDHPPIRWRVHAGTFLEARIDLVAAGRTWDEVPALVDEARSHAATAGLV